MFRLVSNWNNFSWENSEKKKKKLGTKRKAKDSKMLLIKLLSVKQAVYPDTQKCFNTEYKILIFSILGSSRFLLKRAEQKMGGGGEEELKQMEPIH